MGEYLHFWAGREAASGLDTELVNNAGCMCQIIESSNKSLGLETRNSISLPVLSHKLDTQLKCEPSLSDKWLVSQFVLAKWRGAERLR